MTVKEQKIREIISHPNFNGSRTLTSLLKAVEVGISLEEEERLFLIVKEAFKHGKPKSLSYIKHTFERDIKFLKKEFKGIAS